MDSTTLLVILLTKTYQNSYLMSSIHRQLCLALQFYVVAWLSGSMFVSSSPVSTWMGDHLRVGKPCSM